MAGLILKMFGQEESINRGQNENMDRKRTSR